MNPNTVHKNSRPIVALKQIGDYTNNLEGKNTSGADVAWPASARIMTDNRRTKGSTATPRSSMPTPAATSNKFVAKDLRMIDIDMTELKKALQTFAYDDGTSSHNRTVVGLGSTACDQGHRGQRAGSILWRTGPPPPPATNTAHLGHHGTAGNWTNHIYNSGTPTQAVTTVGDSTAFSTRILVAPTTTLTPPVTISGTTATNAFTTDTWNGGVYVESIAAEVFDTTGTDLATRKARTHNAHISGVRLINGRGHGRFRRPARLHPGHETTAFISWEASTPTA